MTELDFISKRQSSCFHNLRCYHFVFVMCLKSTSSIPSFEGQNGYVLHIYIYSQLCCRSKISSNYKNNLPTSKFLSYSYLVDLKNKNKIRYCAVRNKIPIFKLFSCLCKINIYSELEFFYKRPNQNNCEQGIKLSFVVLYYICLK